MKPLPAILALGALMLMALGVVTLDSASVHAKAPYRLYDHLKWLGLGLGVCAALAWFDYRKLRRWRLPVLGLAAATVALGLVLIPGIGDLVNNARRWFRFGGQPSEFAKVALLIWLADYAARHLDRMRERGTGFFRAGLWPLLVAGLVFAEPDWGTAALLAAVAGGVLLAAGTYWGYLLASAIAGVELLTFFLCRDLHRLYRVLVFLDPGQYKDGPGWQVYHSLLSLGSGGLWGPFFGGGSHKHGFVPEQKTDFVFSLIGEELGLVGCTLVLALFAIVLACGIRLVWRTKDAFGQFLALGATLLVVLQACINIAVVTGSMPNKGIPLPFISYGGSNLVAMCACLGLMLSVARHGPGSDALPLESPQAELSPAPAPLGSHWCPQPVALEPGRADARAWWRRLGSGSPPATASVQVLKPYQRPPRPSRPEPATVTTPTGAPPLRHPKSPLAGAWTS
jgi:cell division protein FtsW